MNFISSVLCCFFVCLLFLSRVANGNLFHWSVCQTSSTSSDLSVADSFMTLRGEFLLLCIIYFDVFFLTYISRKKNTFPFFIKNTLQLLKLRIKLFYGSNIVTGGGFWHDLKWHINHLSIPWWNKDCMI